MTTKRPTLKQTRQTAREIVAYIATGVPWDVDHLGIPEDQYRVDRLRDDDLMPPTIANVTRTLRAFVR